MENIQDSSGKWSSVSSEYNGKNVKFGSEGGERAGVHTHGVDCRLKNGIHNAMAIMALADGPYSNNARDLLGKPGNAADLLKIQCKIAREYAGGRMGRNIGISEDHLKIDLQYAIMETLKWMVELQDMVIGVQKNGVWGCADGCSDDEDSDDEDSYDELSVDRRHSLLSTVMDVLDYHNGDEGEDSEGIKFPETSEAVCAVSSAVSLLMDEALRLLDIIAGAYFDVKVNQVCGELCERIGRNHQEMVQLSLSQDTKANVSFKGVWRLGGARATEETEVCGCSIM